MKGNKSTSILGVALVALTMSATLTSVAASEAAVGYWTDSSGEVVRNGAGQCYRTQFWTREYAIAACESADIVDTDKDGIANSKDACPDNMPGVEVDARGCELDSDKDGLVNRLDSCPDTAAESKVDETGCVIVEVVAVVDTDGDGVEDSRDNCASTTAGAPVNVNGCELDSDGDNIVDSLDQCTNTVMGHKVDANGCKLIETLTLKAVTFSSSSNVLKGNSTATLDEVAVTLKRHPDMIIEVAGYSDSQGSGPMNNVLSTNRANSVVNYLISKGVPAANLQAKGYGMNSPIADNSSAAGRAQNRRVELHVVKQPEAQEFQFALDL